MYVRIYVYMHVCNMYMYIYLHVYVTAPHKTAAINGYLPSIMKTIKIRRARHAGSVDEQRQDVQLEPTYSNAVPIRGSAESNG